MYPIWKDFYYMLTDSPELYPDGIVYRVSVNSQIIFEGRAYPKPTDSELYIRINDIVAPYLKTVLPVAGTDQYIYPVKIYVSDGHGGWTQSTTYDFVRDWSYDRSVTPGSTYPCRPIVRRVHPRQYLPMWADDGVYDFTVRTFNTGDFSPEDFNLDFRDWAAETVIQEEETNNGNTFFIHMEDYEDVASIQTVGLPFEVGGCNRYVLYYTNAYGAWDFLPVDANTKESDSVTRHTYDTDYDNTQTYNRGRHNHVNELRHKFIFYTGWLTQEQSLLMHHLLNSTAVFVHDLEKDEIHPLVLTSSSTDYKRDGQLYQYSIEAELAQERVRR